MITMRPLIHIISQTYRGRNIWAHVLAVCITGALVILGIDWNYFLYMHAHASPEILFLADLIGIVVPIALPAALVIEGRRRKDPRLERAGWMIAEAELAAFLIVLAYKSVAGRVSPPFFGPFVDASWEFNFGFLRESVYGGWPSSHTAVAFAAAASIAQLLHRHRLLRWSVFGYAAFIGLSEAIGFHWFSEVIAGALIGTVVGWVAYEAQYGPKD